MNAQIQMLPDAVINKIAAGEVIERPASVMKELIENALDAGATRIDVEAVRGGMQLLSVSDNGTGMNRDNALLAVERHATSKIRTADEVEAVATLGFRGEALSSIAAVSRFTLTTRPRDELSGTEIRMAGARLQDVTDAGCPPGTHIEVRNLFFNVPARRKFLRTEATELAQLRQLFAVYALAHPACGLTFQSDGRETLNLPGGSSLSDRIASLYSPALVNSLRELDLETGGVRISGFAGLPQTGRRDRSEQFVFVNGRPASAPVIYHALNEAYQAVLARGRHPAVFLFVDVPPDTVDVNVHPAKKEVRFRRPSAVRDAIIAAVGRALAIESPAPAPRKPPFRLEAAAAAPPPVRQQDLRIGDRSPEDRRQSPEDERRRPEDETQSPEDGKRRPGAADDTQTEAAPWTHRRLLGRIGGLYAVLETEDGMVLMDPQAAHERVLFEQLMHALTNGAPERQGLLRPETVELMPADAQHLRQHLPVLQEMGFGVSDFGQDSFLVDALPVLLQTEAPAELIGDMARALETGRGGKQAARDVLRAQVARAASRSAVSRRTHLSDAELERLIDDLARTEMPYTCPRGRPTLIFTSLAELNRRFGR